YIYKRDENGSFFLMNSKTKKKIKLRKPRANKDWTEREKKEIISAGVKLKKKVLLEDGILSFDDAYIYASAYLNENHSLKHLFSNRFGYVFIDEMQDTYPHQLKIIDQLFDDSVIVQHIGDLNQAILAGNDGETAWSKKDEHLEITGSWRFSQPIANVLRCVALNPQADLMGFNDVDIPPHIIPRDDNDRDKVLQKFVELIDKYDITTKSDEIDYYFIDVVLVCNYTDGLTIGDYV